MPKLIPPDERLAIGGGLWRGRIYASSFAGLLLRGPAIYHGIFGSAFFQRLYTSNPVPPLMFCTALGYHIFVNLPLIGLAFNFEPFVPLAVVSLALSLGTCALAAFQAKLPPPKCRFWSRPLVALLFLLQPIVRGWAWFKWRAITKPSAPMEVASGPPIEDLPETFTYWSDGSWDRLQFLQTIMARLDAAKCLVQPDTGWTPYDFEVLPSTWIRLRFSTATEELEMGKKHFRCRLTTRWSLLARLLFVLLATALALLIFHFAPAVLWLWFSLLLLPLLGWFFVSESDLHQTLFARLLDDISSAHQIVRLND